MNDATSDNDGLPQGWATVTLDCVCAVNPPKPSQSEVCAETLVTFVPMPAIDAQARAITQPQARTFGEVRKGFSAFRENDVIVAKITPCFENGKAAICRGLTNGLGFGSTEFHVLRPTGAVLPEYVYYFTDQESFRQDGAANMTGSVGQKRVPASWLASVDIPLPPLAEQQRIVAKVEELLGWVNAARERLAKVPALVNRFRESVLAAACSGKLTQDWRDKQCKFEAAKAMLERLRLKPAHLRSDVDLADLPEGWTWVSLRTVMDQREPFCYGVVQPGENNPEGVFLVRAGDLDAGTVDVSNLRRIPRSIDAAYGRSRLTGGEVLVTVVGAGIGQSAIAPAACAGFNIARAVAKIPIRRFSARYALRWLQSQKARTWMDNDAREVARPTLNLQQLETLPLPLPPQAEQDEIVRRVDSLFALADKIEARVRSATARVEKITQAILAKAFRGELVPTEAELARQDDRTYEPVAALLERIRSEREGAGNDTQRRKTKEIRRPSTSCAGHGKEHR
jgi:type I restriction enzyme S subunit